MATPEWSREGESGYVIIPKYADEKPFEVSEEEIIAQAEKVANILRNRYGYRVDTETSNFEDLLRQYNYYGKYPLYSVWHKEKDRKTVYLPDDDIEIEFYMEGLIFLEYGRYTSIPRLDIGVIIFSDEVSSWGGKQTILYDSFSKEGNWYDSEDFTPRDYRIIDKAERYIERRLNTLVRRFVQAIDKRKVEFYCLTGIASNGEGFYSKCSVKV